MSKTVLERSAQKRQPDRAAGEAARPAEPERAHASVPVPSSKAVVDATTYLVHLRERQSQSYQKREAIRQRAAQLARRAALSVLPSFNDVRRAYLFGSVTRPGSMRDDSDIDIAVEGRLDAEEYFALWRELERAMASWVVDVVELDRDLRFVERVRQTGELIYERPDSYAEG